jgi:dihydroceramidase
MYLNTHNNLKGYWELTSSVDWCEANYRHHYMIAETWNTFSNIAYMIGGSLFLYNTYRVYSENTHTHQMRLSRFYLLGLSQIVVGIGSFLFHMTLRRDHQAMDELGMYFAVLTLLYTLLNFNEEYDEQGARKTYLWVFSSLRGAISCIACYAAFIFAVIVYEAMAPIVFQASFGIAILASIFMSAHSSYSIGENLPTNSFVQKTRSDCTTLLHLTVACAVAGFGCWITDNTTCPRYEALKLHSLWHLFTALGCYLWSEYLFQTHFLNTYVRSLTGEIARSEIVRTEIEWTPFPHVKVMDVVQTTSENKTGNL